MRKLYKLSRRSIDSFNRGCQAITKNKTGMTLQEIMTVFSGRACQDDVPIILKLYCELGAANVINERFFIYFDKRSLLPQNRAWNGFEIGKNNWVCDMNEKSGIMFEKPIYLRASNYLDTTFDFEYDSETSLGKYIDKLKEKKGVVDEPEVKSRALF